MTENIEEIFLKFDTDGSGKVSAVETLAEIRRVAPSFKTLNQREVQKFIKSHDKNNDGEIDLDEFKAMVTHLTTGSKKKSRVARAVLAAIVVERSSLGSIASLQTQCLRIAIVTALIWIIGVCFLNGMDSGATDLWAVRLAIGSWIISMLVIGSLIHKHVMSPKPDSWLVISIITMVPIYSLCSCLKLLLPGEEFDTTRASLEAVKEVYEAVVLYDFLELMYLWAGVSAGQPIPEGMHLRHVHFGPPIDWFMPHARFDNELLKMLEFWTLQYICIQPVLAVAHIFFHDTLHHHPWLNYLLITAYIVSTTLSLSALVGFFHTFEAEIHSQSPLLKLFCVKGVVGLCFWQGLGSPHISDYFELAGHHKDGLIDILVSVEMGLLFSFAFRLSYMPSGAKSVLSKETVIRRGGRERKGKHH